MNAMIFPLLCLMPAIISIIRIPAKRRKAEQAAADQIAAEIRAARRAEAEAARRAEAERAEAAAKAAAKQAEKARAEAEREAAAEEKHRAAMRRQQERHEQKMQHIAEERAARAQRKPQKQDETPMTPDEFAAQFAPAPQCAGAAAKRPDAVPAPLPVRDNNAFAGHVVAFTGRLNGMTRAEAIKAVEDNGGRAYATMPAGTTLLVVGDKPGMGKMDKADQWIGQTRKITQKQFEEMLALPLTLTPDKFTAAFAAPEA